MSPVSSACIRAAVSPSGRGSNGRSTGRAEDIRGKELYPFASAGNRHESHRRWKFSRGEALPPETGLTICHDAARPRDGPHSAPESGRFRPLAPPWTCRGPEDAALFRCGRGHSGSCMFLLPFQMASFIMWGRMQRRMRRPGMPGEYRRSADYASV